MIHILLMILKIIGIIIAAILGLLLLLLLIFLCVPVRYRLDASMPGEIKKSRVQGRVTWLLHLIRLDVIFENQELKWKVRIAWKKLENEPDGHESERKETHEKENDQNRKEKQKEQGMESSGGLQKVAEKPEKEKRVVESSKTASENVEERSGKKTEKNVEKIKKTAKIDAAPSQEEKTGRFEKIKCTIGKFCDKIKHTVGHAEETLEKLSAKKDRIVKELEDPVHQKAFFKVKKELGKLLKRWKPKVMEGNVRFGFEDPYHTGQALAALSIVYPFIGGHLSLEPDFEQRILRGDVKVRGGICVMPLVCLLWNLVWCKEIRKTYHDVRNFKW